MKNSNSFQYLLCIAIKRMILVCTWFFTFTDYSGALEVPKWKGYVNDYAGMISADTKTQIENDLKLLEQTDSTQIYILTVPSLEGEVLEEFAIQVFDVWKAGQKKLDNGVILIVAQKERKIRIEVGRGLEGKLTDLEAGRIIDAVMKPKFKAGEFNEGFIAGVWSLIQKTKGQYKAGSSQRTPDNSEIIEVDIGRQNKIPQFFLGLLILIIVLLILNILKVIRRKKISILSGAAVLPVIVLFTIGHVGSATPYSGMSLLCFLVFIGMGGLVGVMSSVLADPATYKTGRRSSSDRDWSGSSGSSDSSSSSSDSGSGGGGGSSGGGGASGDY